MDLSKSIFALGLVGLIVWMLWRFRGKTTSQSAASFSPDLNSEGSSATTPELSSQVNWKLLALPISLFTDATGKLIGDVPDGTFVQFEDGHYFEVSHDSKGRPLFNLVDSSLFQN